MGSVDPLGLALDHATRIKKAADMWAAKPQGEDGESREKHAGGGFKRRAKDFPGLMLSAGLSSALLFYMAKAGDKALEASYRLLSSSNDDMDKLVDELGGELGSKEGSGYALMLAAVVHALEQLAEVNIARGTGLTHSDIARFIRSIRTINKENTGSTLSEIQATMILRPYLVELRKLADAFFKTGD